MIVSGSFVNGRPHVTASLELIRPVVPSRTLLSFLIDTGSDRTLISMSSLSKMGVTSAQLRGRKRGKVAGISGDIETTILSVELRFRHEDGSPEIVTVDVQVFPARPGEPPPLLGRDVLDGFRVIIDRQANIVALTDSLPAV